MQNDTFEPITASLVAEDRRSDFLAAFFEPWLTRDGEKLVHSWLGWLCADYHDDHWHYCALSNGGFYMAPDLLGPLHITVERNGFSRKMSADAAGIAATLFTLVRLARVREGTREGDALINLYHLLRAFALEHVEHGVIDRTVAATIFALCRFTRAISQRG